MPVKSRSSKPALGAASQLGEAERDMGEKMNAEANLPKWEWLLTASKFFP
jgi:hypothetical protein